jgi:hypothetical protein
MVAGIALFKKDAWARKALPWFVGLCLAVGALGFIGCDSDGGGGGGGSILGNWEHNRGTDGISKITVSSTNFKYEDVTEYQGTEYSSVSAGTIEDTTNTEGQAGVIIFKVTEDTYNSSEVGKYTAAYWKELTDTTVSMSTAYKAKGGDGADKNDNAAFFTSLDDAKAQFTLGNNGVWIGTWGGPYTKK